MKTQRLWFWIGLIALVLLLIGWSTGQALQAPADKTSYPARPITIVVTFPPGGGTDLLARQIGAELEQYWQRPVIVENKPGASGLIGARHVAQSAADGYTLLMVNSSYAINPSVFADIGFDPERDLRGVMNVAWVPSVVVVGRNSAVREFKEVLGEHDLSYASCGNGTPQHLAGELLAQKADWQALHVPYRGCGPAISDVMTGQVDVGIVTISSAMALIESGHLRPLAVTSAQRSPILPEIASIQEHLNKEYDLNQWHGLLVPGQTDPARIEQIHQALRHVMEMQKTRDNLETLGYTPIRSTADEFNRIIAADLNRFHALVRNISKQSD